MRKSTITLAVLVVIGAAPLLYGLGDLAWREYVMRQEVPAREPAQIPKHLPEDQDGLVIIQVPSGRDDGWSVSDWMTLIGGINTTVLGWVSFIFRRKEHHKGKNDNPKKDKW